jgi:hypothetical protein
MYIWVFLLDVSLDNINSRIGEAHCPPEMDSVHERCLSPKNVTKKYVLGLSLVYVCGLWKAGFLWCIVEVLKEVLPF